MPYLTPDSIPEESDCRSLFIPASSDWLAIVSGALTELEKKWNWEQYGSVTVDQAVDVMRTMITNYYAGCSACPLPEGGYIIRVNRTTGRVEEITPDGAWGTPTGDYAISPIPPREGGTAQDQKCLAAANAANALQELYEQVSTSFNEHVTEAEAITDFILFIIGILGAEFAPITFAIVAFFGIVFHLLFDAMEFLSADLWDSTFTEQIKCLLLNCAANDAGVVTFDYNCFIDALNAQQNDFGLSEIQLRLYIQILYLLQVTGGSDALDHAGATTALETADCTDCPSNECYGVDWVNFNDTDGVHEYTTLWINERGYCWQVTGDSSTDNFTWKVGDGSPCLYTRVEVDVFTYNAGITYIILGRTNNDIPDHDQATLGEGSCDVGLSTINIDLSGTDSYYGVQIILNRIGSTDGAMDVHGARIHSTNLAAAGLTPNC